MTGLPLSGDTLLASLFIISCKKEVHTVKQEKTEEVLSDLINPFGNYWTQLTNTPVIPGPYSNDRNLSFSIDNKVYVVPLVMANRRVAAA